MSLCSNPDCQTTAGCQCGRVPFLVRMSLVSDPRDATIFHLKSELDRCRKATLREAAEIVRCRADFSMPEGIGPKPPWHRFAYECAYTLEQIAALGGSNDKG